MSKGPVMNRARTQLACSYAPGSLFTFEGGKGCFLAMPDGCDHALANNNPAIRQQIAEQLKEFVASWHDRGIACRSEDPNLPLVHPEQTLDQSLILRGAPRVAIESFVLVEPSRIGYVPSPLNFCCSVCGLLHDYEDVDSFVRGRQKMEARDDCRDRAKHKWSQLDVVFYHWCGSIEPLRPSRNCTCGGEEFRLHKSLTGVFSDWKFECTGCGLFTNLFRTDRDTYDIFNQYPGVRHTIDERTMLPVSYRSGSTFYPQMERFIPHNDAGIIAILNPGREDDLVRELMRIFAYPSKVLTTEDIGQLLEQEGKGFLFTGYRMMLESAEQMRTAGNTDGATECERAAGAIVRDIVAPYQEAETSSELKRQAIARQGYTRRYDPIRLALEHDRIKERYLSATNPRSHADLFAPPHDVCPEWAHGEEGMAIYRREMAAACSVLGIDRICLVKELEIIQYSFGYSRVSYGPVYNYNGTPMPVRLNLFPHVERNRRPIYTLEQKNEAIYVQLRQNEVVKWLAANGVPIDALLADGQRLGASYLEQYADFGFYLDPYRRKNATPRTLPNMVYLLLHSLAHQFMHVIAEFSGLELGSLGECIYPADLAFIVYRSSLTPDLGNISSMWRNFGAAILRQTHDQQTLQCGSGSLCDQRGGACPGCIMIPEVTCLGWNDLLSRSALGGGTTPQWDSSSNRKMVGFLEVTTGTVP